MHEQDGDGEPAHHARRPMNAFLIFCKRHRSVVRDKYPNLENRSITKILGEWWANLDKEDKACYTGLAKQYKDAFLSANPDFKWYKLPAPPLRTLSSRPREVIEKQEFPKTSYHETELEKTNNNSTKVDLNKKSNDKVFEDDQKQLSMFTPGKLADEAQMGGLSSLLATKTETQTPNPYYSPPNLKYNAISTPNDHRSHSILERSKAKGLSREESIRELQNALTETSKIFEEEFDAGTGKVNRNAHGVSNDQFTNQDVIDQIVDKRYSKEEDSFMKNWSDDEKNARSGRSCKGKRYQEFMAVGGLIVNKRQKRDNYDKTPEEDYSASCSWETINSHTEESIVSEELKEPKQESVINDLLTENEIKYETPDVSEPDNNINKTFKAADFDLDAKIRALPSLSLEKFQQKKRENKRKKKSVGLKTKHQTEPMDRIINSVPKSYYDERRLEMAESWRDQMIGSQKRKPRKVTITRLDFNNIAASMEVIEAHQISPEIKLATEAPCTVQSMEICKQPPPHSHVDLLALATLAEVAANKSKIEDSSMVDTMTAKASEENASKV